MSVDLDLTFLNVPLRLPMAEPRPVNVYDILREAWRETRVDMTLQFFLDPNERHGIGTLVIDALLATLDGAPFIGSGGPTGKSLDAQEYQGSTAWEIQTQMDFIDVLATNTDSGVAIVLENKIGHELNNPLRTYAERALNTEGITDVLVVVLAPEPRIAQAAQREWLSRSITYGQLAAEIKRSPRLLEHALDPADRDQRRSLDLLQQFMEARTGEGAMSNDADDAARLDEWRTLFKEHGPAIEAFYRARKDVRAMLKRRRERLEGPIADRISEAGLATITAYGGGSDDFQEVAYHFAETDWVIGLCLSSRVQYPEMYVYDNPSLSKSNRRRQPFGLAWTDTDDELAEAFLARVTEILAEVSSGSRS